MFASSKVYVKFTSVGGVIYEHSRRKNNRRRRGRLEEKRMRVENDHRWIMASSCEVFESIEHGLCANRYIHG